MRRFWERFLLRPCQRLPSSSTKSSIYNHHHCHPVWLEEGDEGGGRGPSDVAKLPLNLTWLDDAFKFSIVLKGNMFTFVNENTFTFFSPYFFEGKYFRVCDKYFYICKGFLCEGNSFTCVQEIFLLLWRKMWNWKEQSLQVVEPNTLPPPHFCEGNIGMETPYLQQSWETNISTFVKEIFLFL